MPITKTDINKYIAELEIGSLIDVRVRVFKEDIADGYTTRVLKAVVEDKLPFLTKTSRGYFAHKDIYFWNNGGYVNDR